MRDNYLLDDLWQDDETRDETYEPCWEISCDECNDRYGRALARIAELEQMVRELAPAHYTPEAGFML